MCEYRSIYFLFYQLYILQSRRSATGGSGKIKGRQIAKQKVVQEQLPIEEPSPANEENETSKIDKL
jgi:hypothetical protein